MAPYNGGFLHSNQTSLPAPALLPPWLSNSNGAPAVRPPSTSVMLSLASSTVAASPPITWLQPERGAPLPDTSTPLVIANLPSHASIAVCGESLVMSELVECCTELDEGHHTWKAQKKEAAWRLRRVELQLESEKACRRREKMEEIEEKVKALKEEQKAALERIEAEYTEQLAGLRKDAEAKEQKLAEQWPTKHLRLTKFVEQMGCRPRIAEPNSQ